MRNQGCVLNKITASGLATLLLVAGLPPPATAQSCQGWNTAKFFATATVDQVRACLSAGEDPNKSDTQGRTVLHWAARKTSDPAVIEALLDAGANPRAYSRAGRLPWQFARKNDKINDSDAFQRLRIVSVPARIRSGSAKKADWARVQAVPHNTKTQVRLYQDAVPRRFKGRFDSATDDSITLVLDNGQTRTFPKQDVRKVLIPRPFVKRNPGWITLGIVFALLQIWMSTIDRVDNVSGATMAQGHAMITLPIAGAAFLASKMGAIYDMPPRYRTLTPIDQQPGDQGNDSGKQQEPERPTS